MSARHEKQFAATNKRAKTSPAVTLVCVPQDLCRPTIATAKTLTSVSFTKTAAHVLPMPNASIPSAHIVVTAKLVSKTRQATIENAWTWTSAKSILVYASIAALIIGAPTNAAVKRASSSVPTTEHATTSTSAKSIKLISSALGFAKTFPDLIAADVPKATELARTQGHVKVKKKFRLKVQVIK